MTAEEEADFVAKGGDTQYRERKPPARSAEKRNRIREYLEGKSTLELKEAKVVAELVGCTPQYVGRVAREYGIRTVRQR